MALTKITSTNIGANAVTTSAVNLTAPLAFANSTANVAFFAANGNIGIGTATPGVALDVSGAVKSNSYSQYGSSMYYGIGSSLSGSYGATDLAVYNGANGNTVFLTNNTERMRIDSSGRVTKPYQPMFSVRNANQQQITNSTGNQVMVFATVNSNIGSHYNTSNSRFTAPVNGYYLFAYNTVFDAPDTIRVCEFTFRVNGGTDYGITSFFNYGATAGGNEHPGLSMTAVIYLLANEYVNVVQRTHNDITGSSTYTRGDANGFYGYQLG